MTEEDFVSNGTGVGTTANEPASKPFKAFLLSLGLALVALALIVYYKPNQNLVNFKTPNLTVKLQSTYMRILVGRETYCEKPLEAKWLTWELACHYGIVNQNEALRELEQALQNDTNNPFKAIVLVGPVGVGKNMWARALAQHFQWPENTYTYIWDFNMRFTTQAVAVGEVFIDKLSDCGYNLLIVQNLSAWQPEVVEILNRMIKTAQDTDRARNCRVLIIYVFNVNSLGNTLMYYRLQSLPNAKTVNFQAFGITELKECVRQAAAIENLELSPDEVTEIATMLQPTGVGCKQVNKLLLKFKIGRKSQQALITAVEA